MSEDQKVVEKKEETATTPPQSEVAVTASEVDNEAELTKLNAELEKTRQERENYRKGMLKAKGKLPEEETETPEELDALIDRKVQEKFLSTQEAQILAKKDALIEKTLRRNKELEIALKARGQITSNTGQGSNQDKSDVKIDAYFSKDQLAEFKRRGFSDKKIEEVKKNMITGNQLPPIIK